MSKISELGKIVGANTKSRDLFVTVNLDQGDDGTKNITREELVNAIEQEVFDAIKINGGDYIRNIPIDNVTIDTSVMQNSIINNSVINNPNINVEQQFISPIEGDDYFYLKDVSLGETVAISYSELYKEIAESAKKALKVYVSVDGDDENNGSYLAPVKTLERAVEMAQAASRTVIPGVLGRPNVNISVNPGTYYTYGELELPDFCSMTSTTGQYTTTIVMLPGYETKNCLLVGNGCYVQGFSFFNNRVDNFDYPSGGFAFAFRPGVRFTRSPYVRDCSQISNYFERDNPPLLNPFNSKGTVEDLGYEITLQNIVDRNGDPSILDFEVGDTIKTSNGATGVISRIEEIESEGVIFIRNNVGTFEVGTTIETSSGGTAEITIVGEEDFPNKEVGRGGGMILADRDVCDPDSIFTYFLCFGATPRTQNGLGYVAKNGAGINGISSLSIFSRCAFYALNGGQISLNNSGTQFGDISMRAKGSMPVFNPYETTSTIPVKPVLGNAILDNADAIIDDLIDNYITADLVDGGLGLQGYDSVKCARDVGYILEGVGYDTTLGTNYWSIINGVAYRRAESSVVVNEQQAETAGAIVRLKEEVLDLIDLNTDAAIRVSASFDETIDILSNGEESRDPLTFTSTGNQNHTNARSLLLENRSLLQDIVISYINSAYPSLPYDQDLCRRDTGYIIDGLAHDLNYNTNIATLVNVEAYFIGAVSNLPEDQRKPTADAFKYLGQLCAACVLGELGGQSTNGGNLATEDEAISCAKLINTLVEVIENNDLQYIQAPIVPDTSWVDFDYINARDVIDSNVTALKKKIIGFVNSEYNFIDINLTRRDTRNLLTSLSNDFKTGRQTGTRIFAAGLFTFQGTHVFSVFNPTTSGLKFIDRVEDGNLPDGSTNDINDAYIVYPSGQTGQINTYAGEIFYWDGTEWVSDGQNDIDLLNAFTGSWDHIRQYINNNIITDPIDQNALDGLINDVLIESVYNPRVIRFGSLVESLSHQFNLASAGVNVNALPLNFRRLGQPISAAASVSQEEGGRVRWSGADELNNQYFARGLRINGRTGRLEGRPFTSSVRKLARRASNSRASL